MDTIVTTPAERPVVIQPPNFEIAKISIEGISPYVQHKFSAKARSIMAARQREGSRSRKDRRKEPKDFEAMYRDAMHVSTEGWCGIPASAFRNGSISACRLAGFAMTRAKLSLFVEQDGLDATDGTPLVRIYGEPRVSELPVRLESGVADISWRPMWEKWSAVVTCRWDADQFSANDVINLMNRVGQQVGIGEGRPDSPNSNGMGWGLFKVVS